MGYRLVFTIGLCHRLGLYFILLVNTPFSAAAGEFFRCSDDYSILNIVLSGLSPSDDQKPDIAFTMSNGKIAVKDINSSNELFYINVDAATEYCVSKVRNISASYYGGSCNGTYLNFVIKIVIEKDRPVFGMDNAVLFKIDHKIEINWVNKKEEWMTDAGRCINIGHGDHPGYTIDSTQFETARGAYVGVSETYTNLNSKSKFPSLDLPEVKD